MSEQLPPYLDATEVIPFFRFKGSWKAQYRRGVRMLREVGVIRKRKSGGLQVVTSKLNSELPEVYDLVCDGYR